MLGDAVVVIDKIVKILSNCCSGDHGNDAQTQSECSIGDHARLAVECQTKGRSNARDERGISARHRKQLAELA